MVGRVLDFIKEKHIIRTIGIKIKFFMYVCAQYNGKKLFVLECREELLMHMMKFVKRTVLDHDYVPQEKKNK